MSFSKYYTLLKVVECDFKITKAAKALGKPQPTVSLTLSNLEKTYQVQIFKRNGRQVVGLTATGKAIVKQVKEMLQRVDNIDRIISDGLDPESSEIVVGTTQTQARYTLNAAIKKFRTKYPHMGIKLVQGSPAMLGKYVEDGTVDFALITEEKEQWSELMSIPCFRWQRSIIADPAYIKASGFSEEPSFMDLMSLPVISYEFSLDRRSDLSKFFAKLNIEVDVAIAAADVEVIKTYVAEQMGIGIIAKVACDDQKDRNLKHYAEGILPEEKVWLTFQPGTRIRQLAREFIYLYAPHLNYALVDEILTADVKAPSKPSWNHSLPLLERTSY